ncbi:hypothetical protein OXIME_000113 [Oxyplasma meridianum]|uniref:Uncharacterized protein n=1 Tax=Oxyplasma meridianum TaxID=3073602 RepID=A0AAX4NE18_9ARCH
MEKHHVYVPLFYDIKNSRVIPIEEGKSSSVSGKFMVKHPSIHGKNIERVT